MELKNFNRFSLRFCKNNKKKKIIKIFFIKRKREFVLQFIISTLNIKYFMSVTYPTRPISAHNYYTIERFPLGYRHFWVMHPRKTKPHKSNNSLSVSIVKHENLIINKRKIRHLDERITMENDIHRSLSLKTFNF